MRRLLVMVMMVVFIITAAGVLPVMALDEGSGVNEITVFLDGIQLKSDVPPVIQNGHTLVPFRTIAEALHIEVNWDDTSRRVIADNGDTCVQMSLDGRAWINDNLVNMETPPVIINGTTLVPARFFSEAFDCKVNWDPVNLMVMVSSPPKSMKVTGFYALGDEKTSSWSNLFNQAYPETAVGNTGVISNLALGWYSLDEAGNLLTVSDSGWQRPQGWENVLNAAENYDMNTEMLIHFTDKNGQLCRFLNDDAAVKQAIDTITKESASYQGVNLDFEGLGFEETGSELNKTRRDFNQFVAQLAGELKKEDKELILCLHAPNSAYPGYDYASLGQVADYIIIMAYDYGEKPEPNSRVTKAVEMAASFVAPEKILLGISADSENAESLVSKVGIAKKYNLGGIALWRLGLLSDGMWEVLADNIIKPSEQKSVTVNNALSLLNYNLTMELPGNWVIQKQHESLAYLLNEEAQETGMIEVLGSSFLPSYSQTLAERRIQSSLGEGSITSLRCSLPDASGSREQWYETHLLLPLDETRWFHCFIKTDDASQKDNTEKIIELIAGSVRLLA